MRTATCRTASVYSGALIRGNTYEILDENREKGQVKVRGENGRTRWFNAGCFDFECKPVPVLVDWEFDDQVSEDDDGTDPNWIEVSFNLSDGSRRWCILYTPERLLSSLSRPDLDPPGLHIRHMIIVRSYRREDIERTIRYLDEEEELVHASKELFPATPNVGNIFHRFDFTPGTVTDNPGHLEMSLSPEDYDEHLTEDLLQVEYPGNYVLDVGWYSGIRRFIVYVIENANWENPIVKTVCSTVSQLEEYIPEAISLLRDLVEEDAKAAENDKPWPYADPPNVWSFSTMEVIREHKPIVWVTHDDDGSWQFHGESPARIGDAMVVALGEVVKMDPTVVELADLPLGWVAWRESEGAPWQREMRVKENTDKLTTLNEMVLEIETREDLAEFVSKMKRNLNDKNEEWENNDLGSFLEGMEGWIRDLDGYILNRGEEIPEQPSWGLIGKILLAARIYE